LISLKLGLILHPKIPWTGNQAYGKNLRIQMGRCPVRSIFPQSLKMLEKKQDSLGWVERILDGQWTNGQRTLTADRFMFDNIMPLSEAVEGYDLFDKRKVQKVVFTP
jgi:threonine dehydrogenase-like Zn-dependent dehydrogenase